MARPDLAVFQWAETGRSWLGEAMAGGKVHMKRDTELVPSDGSVRKGLRDDWFPGVYKRTNGLRRRFVTVMSIHTSLVENLNEAISDLGEESAIEGLDWRSYHLLVAIRAVLRNGFRGASLLDLVREITPLDTLEYLSGLPSYHPMFEENEERELAWIMVALNEGLLGCYINVLRDNPKILKKYYAPNSIMQRGISGVLEAICELMTGKAFLLSIKDYVRYRQEEPTPDQNDETQSGITTASSVIVTKRSPEPVKGLVDVLDKSPRVASPILAELRSITERPVRTPIIVVDQSVKDVPHPSPRTASVLADSTIESTASDQHIAELEEAADGLFASIFKQSILGRLSSDARPPSHPQDAGLVAQRFQCSSCNAQITCDTSQRCINCGKYKCPLCFFNTNDALVVPGQVQLNWDYSHYVCCNQCTKSHDPYTFLSISHIIEYALLIDGRFRRAWDRHIHALPVAFELLAPCLSAPDTESVFLNNARAARLSDLLLMHGSGSDPISDAAALHLSRCTDCQSRASRCMVCGEGELLVPLLDPKARFCEKCLGGWHDECERHCPRCL